MKIYLAGAYPERPRLRNMRQELLRAGHIVTSDWLDAPDDLPYAPDDIGEHAYRDLKEIRVSDLLILDTVGESRGGRDFEAGFAYGRIPVLVVGPRTHAFTHLEDVVCFEDWSAMLPFLRAWGHTAMGWRQFWARAGVPR